MFNSGQWSIIKNLHPKDWKEWSCTANGGEIFYQQDGEKLHSEGWYSLSKNITDKVLSVYALEECSMYIGAYLHADTYFVGKYLPIGDIDACLEEVFSTELAFFQLVVTTKSITDLEQVTECLIQKINDPSVATLTGGKIILSSDDEKAKIFIGDKNCYKNLPPITKHISKAKSHRPMISEDQNTGEFPLATMIGGGVGACVVLLLVLLCVWRRKGILSIP